MTESLNQPIADKCPRWASDLIIRIRDLEVQLGNIRPDSSEAWQVNHVTDVFNRLEDPDSSAVFADLVESLFAKVTRGLKDEGFASDEIATFINSRIPSGKLSYCNRSEVEAAFVDG
jgi:hypothetical protein